MSNNIDWSPLASGAANPEVVINDAFGKFDGVLSDSVTIDLTSASVTLTTAQEDKAVIFVTGATTAGRTLTFQAIKRKLTIFSATSNTQSFSLVRGSTSIPLAIGNGATVYTDGTTNGMIAITGSSSSGATTLAALSDVDVTTAPTDKQVLSYNAATSKWIPRGWPVVDQTTNYTFALSDAGSSIRYRSTTTAGTFTIPLNASVPFPIGTVIEIGQFDVGALTIAATSGVTLRIPITGGVSSYTIGQSQAYGRLRKMFTDSWHFQLYGLPDRIPSQTGNSGKYLITDGTTPSWATFPISVTGNWTVYGNLYVNGTATFNGLATFNNDVNMNGVFYFDQTNRKFLANDANGIRINTNGTTSSANDKGFFFFNSGSVLTPFANIYSGNGGGIYIDEREGTSNNQKRIQFVNSSLGTYLYLYSDVNSQTGLVDSGYGTIYALDSGGNFTNYRPTYYSNIVTYNNNVYFNNPATFYTDVTFSASHVPKIGANNVATLADIPSGVGGIIPITKPTTSLYTSNKNITSNVTISNVSTGVHVKVAATNTATGPILARAKPASNAEFTWTVIVQWNILPHNYTSMGVCLMDDTLTSGEDRLCGYHYLAPGPGYNLKTGTMTYGTVFGYNNQNTEANSLMWPIPIMGFRIRETGTQRIFGYSIDGINFLDSANYVSTGGYVPSANLIGLFAWDSGVNDPYSFTVLSDILTTGTGSSNPYN